MEIYETTDPKIKCIGRVCLVNEAGERPLDTLVAPETYSDPSVRVRMKEGLKTKLFELAKAKGPSMQDVREAVKYFLNNKKVVGYHLPMKLTELGLIGIQNPVSC